MRQAPAGRFTEQALAEVPGPAHVAARRPRRATATSTWPWPAWACSSPTTPASAPCAARERRAAALHAARRAVDKVPRVADVRAGDLDGDGDLDLSVALFGYDQGETRWLENTGGWRFDEPDAAGAVGRRSTPRSPTWTATAISTSSRSSARSGRRSTSTSTTAAAASPPARIFGASNEDFGSSWISLADLDARRRSRRRLQQRRRLRLRHRRRARLERRAVAGEHRRRARSRYHRIADIPGASSPQAADLDGDGDLDIAVVSAYNNWAEPDGAEPGVARERRQGAPSRCATWPRAPTHLVTLAVGDLTGDGRPDLVTGGMHMSWPYDRMSRLTLWTNTWGGDARDRPACRCGRLGAACVAAVGASPGSARRRARRAAPAGRGALPATRASRPAGAGARADRRGRSQAARARAARPPRVGRAGHRRITAASGPADGARRLRAGRSGSTPASPAVDLSAQRCCSRSAATPAARAPRSSRSSRPRRRTAWRGSASASSPSSAARSTSAQRRTRGPATRRPSRRSCRRGSRPAQSMPLAAYARLGLARVALERGQREAAGRELRGDPRRPIRRSARRTALRRELERAGPQRRRRPRGGFEAPYVPPADPRSTRSSPRRVDSRPAAQARRAGHARRRRRLARVPACGGRWRLNPADLNVLMEMAALRQARAGRPRRSTTSASTRRWPRRPPHAGRTGAQPDRLGPARRSRSGAAAGRAWSATPPPSTTSAGARSAGPLGRGARPLRARAGHRPVPHPRDEQPRRRARPSRPGGGRRSPSSSGRIAIAPANAEYYVNYGSALMRRAASTTRSGRCTRQSALTPRDANAHNNLGIALAQPGRPGRGARDAFDRALAIDPGHAERPRQPGPGEPGRADTRGLAPLARISCHVRLRSTGAMRQDLRCQIAELTTSAQVPGHRCQTPGRRC